MNGNMKGYVYEEGYLRTSCSEYSVTNLANREVHLTNDAIQKKADGYGEFEDANKLSYVQFQTYLDTNCPQAQVCFDRDILPQIKNLTTDAFRAVWGKIDGSKRINTFECYGLDCMLDEDFKVYLIEINTNPSLDCCCPLL